MVETLSLCMIETVNSIKLAKKLNHECSKIEERQRMPPLDVLVQVIVDNHTGTKHGVDPANALKLSEFIRDHCPFLNFCGIMSMGKIGDIEEFKAIHKLKLKMLENYEDMKKEEFVVSMGTSGDYE